MDGARAAGLVGRGRPRRRAGLLALLSVVVILTLPVTLALLSQGAPAPLLFAWVVIMDIGLKVGLLVLLWGARRPRSRRPARVDERGRPAG